MKVLNLVYKENSDISYEVQKFPDGQQNVVLKSIPLGVSEPVTIKSRLNDFHDLELIICAASSLRNLGVKEIHLYTPFFLGSRSDRQFEDGGNNYLKQVICPIINSLNFESVTVLDPHSDVLEACLNNYKKKSNFDLLRWINLNHINIDDKETVLVSPDAGALKKIYPIAKGFNNPNNVIICSKSRDLDGKLTEVTISEVPSNKNALIIDDICDGGATFINIAKEFSKRNLNNKLFLVVTHGIFSKGLTGLSELFECIYSTNSYQDIHDCKFYKKLNVF